jgi:hypothetical protein
MHGELMTISERTEQHNQFWMGEGPSLIFIPPSDQVMYDLDDYPTRFRNPNAMWESEIQRAKAVVDWPTDGIPTVRPNLGVIFVPTMASQGYTVKSDQMPWPGEPISRDAIRAARDIDVSSSELMSLARDFYRIHRERASDSIAPYHADTQGVFDIAHLLYGDHTFYDMADSKERAWIDELLDICHHLYVNATVQVKQMIGEDMGSMIHGHGTAQGLFFPNAGVRSAEDTPTLLSPRMIEEMILPVIDRVAEVFEGVFVHYCGKHEPFFELLCEMKSVPAIDLGNPEMYDSRWLLEQCTRTETVLYSCIVAEHDENWRPYINRIAGIVRETGARVVLRPEIYPDNRIECAEMLDMWHSLTS